MSPYAIEKSNDMKKMYTSINKSKLIIGATDTIQKIQNRLTGILLHVSYGQTYMNFLALLDSLYATIIITNR